MTYPKAEWNTALGRSRYDRGDSYGDIAKACKTTRNAIIGYAKSHHWPERQCDVDRFAKKFPTGAVAKTPPPGQQPCARPLPEGASTLPPLRSLTFGDD